VTTSLSGGNAVVSADAPDASDAVPARPRVLALVVLGLTAVVVVGIDLATKQLALSSLSDGSVVRILGGAVYFDLTRNSGAAFSMGSNLTVLFPIITLVVLGGIVWLARRLRSVPWALSMGLVVGGALGNLMDRLFRAPGPLHGHVVDFISVFAPNAEAFPIFNAADSSLFCGVALAILLEFTGRRRDGSRVSPDAGREANAGAKGASGEVRDSQREDA
jgi:signal peptidase II